MLCWWTQFHMHIYDYMVCEKATIKNAAATINLTTCDIVFDFVVYPVKPYCRSVMCVCLAGVVICKRSNIFTQ